MADIEVTVNGFYQEFDYDKSTGTITFPDEKGLTNNEILEYEIGKSSLLKTYFMMVFPAYSRWVINRNITRYRNFKNRQSVVVTYKS